MPLWFAQTEDPKEKRLNHLYALLVNVGNSEHVDTRPIIAEILSHEGLMISLRPLKEAVALVTPPTSK